MKEMANIELLKQVDPEVGNSMDAELARQRNNLELIASENIVSEAVMAAMGSVLTNKYAEGLPGKRYYGGCQCVDVVEDIAPFATMQRTLPPSFSAFWNTEKPQLFTHSDRSQSSIAKRVSGLSEP